MFKKGNNIFSLLVIILSIFMTSTSNVVNADSTSLGASTPQTTATTSKDSGTTGTENTNGTTDAEGITNTAPTSTESTTDTDSSTSKIDDSTKQSSTTDWGNQLITEVQLQDSTGNPLTEFHQNDNMRAYWEFSTAKNGKNNVINKGDTMEVSVPKEIALSNNDSANVYQKGTSTILGTANLSKDNRTITVTFNDTAASLSKNSEVTGSFWVNVNWDVNNTTVGKDIDLDWTNQGSAQNNPGSTGTANIKPSVPDATEELYKYGGFIDKTIQWTVRINYAGDTIDNAVYKDFIGPNQTLLDDAEHPVKIYSATANHDTGEITADSNNLMAGKEITKTNDGFTVDLGTITHTVMIVYYTSVDNYDNLSNYYGNTGDLYSNKTEIQNVPVNISTNKLGSDAGAGSAITSITGHKIWSVPAGTVIPSQVTINLLDNNGTVVRHQNVSKDNDWFYEFNNLPKYDSNGTEIKYTVSEDAVKGFTGLPTGNHDITNILTPDTSTIKITKIWHDGNNKYNMRPNSIKVGLYGDSNNKQTKLANNQSNEATLTATDNNWSHTWTGFTNPTDIWYISELDPDQSSTNTPYIISKTQDALGNKYEKTITNTLATNFTVKKVWDDNNNTKKARPDSIKIQLYANDKTSGDPVTLDSTNGWTHSFSRLPKFDDNDKEITYTAKETSVPEGYSSTSSIKDSDTTHQTETITNTYKSTTPETTQVKVNKVWKDTNTKPTHDPITVHLLADDKDTGKTVKLSDENSWSGSFTNLDKQANGKDITYTVKEDTPTGYDSAISKADGTNDFTITNTPTQTTPTTCSFTVKKVWADGKTNHDAVEVYLTKNGTKTGEPVPLNKDNNWSYTWNDLAINNDDKAIEYSAIEDPVPDGYVANIDTTNDGVQITNTAKPTTDEKTSLTVTKSWNDEDNKDKLQPSSVTVKLLANDKDTGKSITLNKGNNWTDTFKNLDKKDNDKDITYSVKENDVSGYEASYKFTDSSHVTIINTHTPKSVTPSDNKRTFTVIKKWADDNNSGNTRPSEIKVQLTANGENVGDPVTLNAKGGWTNTWSDLDKQENGKDIKYSVNEVSVKGYTTNVTDTNDGSTITNTLIPVTPPVDSKTELTVTKSWNDENNKDGIRPDSVKVSLLADGKDTGKSITLDKGNNWTDTFKNLDKKVNDKDVTYSVKENDVSGYEATSTSTDATHITIINKHTPKSVTPSDNKRTFTVIKKWADDNNADSTRPSEIKVQLTANGKNVGDPVTLNAKDGWTNTWSNLDKQENGKDITYSVKEIKVPGYTTKTVTKDGLATITNTLNHVTPPVDNKTNLTVTKTWNDKNNQDKIRPDQVKVQLLADGKNTGDPVILNADNYWSYTWNNLDKNAKYSVKETPVTGYTTEVKQIDDNNISIINTHSTNTPVNPGKPGNPDKPTTPTNPTIPTTPTEPEQPTEPSNPNTSTDTDLIPSESNNNESTSTDSTPLLPDNPLTPAKASDPNTSNEDVTKGLLPQTGNQTTWILSLLGLIVLIGLGFYELIRKLA